MNFASIFSDSFDTFKVLANMDVSKASFKAAHTPKSVWQILNHLVLWQEFQLDKIKGRTPAGMDELDTWKTGPAVHSQQALQQVIGTFNQQIEDIKQEIMALAAGGENLAQKLTIIQEMSVHLSFHLGEMVLLMRQNGHYPWPGEMKDFLAT
ncbi:DinB family protein [Pontibacter actiniarum]|uniref:DinB-like domain-containing protein n=1 Tax=Pontibacter actiniarum TaxID=323450 RepID=A0A1X9YQM1_9BACT|nr:DinB family protein [Pontibacter actiniarum]ARS35165.1 hypothetical protein CA264_06755 [Pontibacter actiniarum]